MVPEGWKQVHLGSLMTFKNGLNTEKEQYGDGHKFVNVMDILRSNILTEDKIIGRVKVSERELNDYRLEFGDILFNRTSETFDEIATAAVYMDNATATFGGFVIRGRPDKNFLSAEFSTQAFLADSYRSQVVKLGQGAVRANIGQKELSKVKILLPPLSEQKKIAKILANWDQAIAITEQSLENSQQQKKALMQWLLTGKKRLPGFDSQWRKLPLTSCLLGSNLRNSSLTQGADRIMSVNKIEGMIPMRAETIGKSIDRYKVVKTGWFAYNPMRINVGSICRWSGDSDCLVSPDYVVFSCNEELLLGSYFDHFRQAEPWANYMRNAGNGSVRVRIYLNDLSLLKIPLPTLGEQAKIAVVLTTAEQEIKTLRRKLACFKQEKKALMQQLLTGERRVNLDELEVA
ncbi:restriction endonuclease subunit S [Stutzerimonas kunmingensis]|uniref:restriction endonuclease subunit S n=1 Tax=Stutzerimonas kunmingensis TaxID=1211807 RepID=UPI003AB7D766